jgi:prefoldin subunit 5
MIGKLTYDQIEEILNILSTSSNNLKDFLENYNGTDMISTKSKKVVNFCNELDKYIANMKSNISINKDADKVVNDLKARNS